MKARENRFQRFQRVLYREQGTSAREMARTQPLGLFDGVGDQALELGRNDRVLVSGGGGSLCHSGNFFLFNVPSFSGLKP